MQDRESAVDAHGVALLRNGTIGAFVNKGARTAFRNCAFTFNGSTGAETRDRNSSITMRHCSVTHNGRVGVYAHSAASVLLRSCRVAACRRPVLRRSSIKSSCVTRMSHS